MAPKFHTSRLTEEAQLQISIVQYLHAVLPAAAAATLIHVVNEGKRNVNTGRILKRMGMKAGVEDLQFIWKGRLCAIEVKPEGGYLRPVQRERRDAVWAAGGNYAVCRSTLDVRDTLAEWDVPTKEIWP